MVIATKSCCHISAEILLFRGVHTAVVSRGERPAADKRDESGNSPPSDTSRSSISNMAISVSAHYQREAFSNPEQKSRELITIVSTLML